MHKALKFISVLLILSGAGILLFFGYGIIDGVIIYITKYKEIDGFSYIFLLLTMMTCVMFIPLGLINIKSGLLGLKTSKKIILNSPFMYSGIAVLYYIFLIIHINASYQYNIFLIIFMNTKLRFNYICMGFIFIYIVYAFLTYRIQRKMLN